MSPYYLLHRSIKSAKAVDVSNEQQFIGTQNHSMQVSGSRIMLTGKKCFKAAAVNIKKMPSYNLFNNFLLRKKKLLAVNAALMNCIFFKFLLRFFYSV